MSVKIMGQVFDIQNTSTISPGARLVLLSLADHADDNGVCWPSLTRIALKCGMKKPSISRIVKQLEQENYLKIERRLRRDGSSTSNKYTILPVTPVNNCATGVNNESGGGGASRGGEGRARLTGGSRTVNPFKEEPSVKPSLNHLKEDSAAQVLKAYNNICGQSGLPAARMTTRRRQQIQTRMKEKYFRENYRQVFALVAASSFCCGENARGFRVDLGWLIKNDENYVKVMEGRYANPQSNNGETATEIYQANLPE